MTKVAIWCRHINDDLIGIGAEIPWSVPSDVARFLRIITGQSVVMGRKTYETLLDKKQLPADKIFILTANQELEVVDKAKHLLIGDLKMFKSWEDDLYIAGGATIYEQFVCGESKLQPEIIVDCVYKGEINHQLVGEKITITPCIEQMNKAYRKVSIDFEKDQVTTTIYIKKGEFVEQAVLKSLLQDIEGE